MNQRHLYKALGTIIVLLGLYVFFRYLLIWLMPFFVAYVIVSLLQPVINAFSRKTRLKTSQSALIVMIIFYIIVFSTVGLGIFELLNMSAEMALTFPEWISSVLLPSLIDVIEQAERLLFSALPGMSIDTFAPLYRLLESSESLLLALTPNLIVIAQNMITKIPVALISIIVTIVISFFLAIDFTMIKAFVWHQLNKDVQQFLIHFNHKFASTVFKMGRSYALILSITFIQLFIGLLILRVEFAFWIALGIALFDILPVVGTGGIVLPWAIISILYRNTFLGIGLFVLYGVITVVRQIVEPKIIGDQVGLHPIVTILSMILGVNILGVIGLFGFPIVISILVKLQEEGKFQWFKPLSSGKDV
jgi:sporulation integral membrane protein YtvI